MSFGAASLISSTTSRRDLRSDGNGCGRVEGDLTSKPSVWREMRSGR